MNWKEFIRLTKLKIIMFIVLVIIVFISYIGSMPVTICIEGPCPQPTYTIIFGYVFWILGFFLLMTNISPIYGLVGIIIEIMVLYTLSCIIISVYNKFK